MATHHSLLQTVLRLEDVASRYPAFARLYGSLFYHRMIRIELEHASLRPGDRVLHVGCGPFPVTALALAARGFRVTALDRSTETIKLNRARYGGGTPKESGGPGITFLQGEAGTFDYRGYRAILVALHVAPRRAMLRQIIATADPGTRILLRNPRGSLVGAYTRLRAEDCNAVQGVHVRRLPGQKELLILRAPTTGSATAMCSLCDLARSQGGTIHRVPEHPQLETMGFRQGKVCSIIAVQPFGGPVICSIAGRDVAVERSIAENILVEPNNGVS